MASQPKFRESDSAVCLPLHRFAPLLLVATPLLVGCGGELIHTTGVVELDGTAVPNAAVMFLPVEGGRPATGRTDADGRFVLTSLEAGDGVTPGAYKVAITACEALVQEDEAGPLTDEDYDAQVHWIVPEPYSRAETSGLEVTVSRSSHHFQFALSAGRP